jgi:hypothetical protein
MSAEEPAMDGPRLTKIYRKIRTAIEENNAQHKLREEKLKADLDVVAKMMLAHMGDDTGRNTGQPIGQA